MIDDEWLMNSHEDEIAKFAASLRLRKRRNLQRLCELYDACDKFTALVMVHQKVVTFQ